MMYSITGLKLMMVELFT